MHKTRMAFESFMFARKTRFHEPSGTSAHNAVLLIDVEVLWYIAQAILLLLLLPKRSTLMILIEQNCVYVTMQ
jgi:hypothetical protein